MTKTVKRSTIASILSQTGTVFTMLYLNRMGVLRVMSCRFTRQLQGDRPVIQVWDVRDRGYRQIKLDNVIEIHSGGHTYELED